MWKTQPAWRRRSLNSQAEMSPADKERRGPVLGLVPPLTLWWVFPLPRRVVLNACERSATAPEPACSVREQSDDPLSRERRQRMRERVLQGCAVLRLDRAYFEA